MAAPPPVELVLTDLNGRPAVAFPFRPDLFNNPLYIAIGRKIFQMAAPPPVEVDFIDLNGRPAVAFLLRPDLFNNPLYIAIGRINNINAPIIAPLPNNNDDTAEPMEIDPA